MKRALNKTLYIIAYGFWYLVALLPFPVLYLLSDGLYLLMSRVVRYRHKVIWKNLKNSFPEKTDNELRLIERGFYHWFCDYIVETLKLITMSKEQLMKRMTFTGTEELNRILSEGKSAGVYLGHLGNWDNLPPLLGGQRPLLSALPPIRKRILRPPLQVCSRTTRCALYPYAGVTT